MARVRKLLATYGTHHSPDGPVTITPQRAQHWADQHAAMTAAGLKVPFPFGHQRRAVPCDPADPDEAAYLASKYNGGYLASLAATPAGVVGVIDAPGLIADAAGNLIDPQTGAAISEVSIGIDSITDGRQREWNDCIVHVATTPWPVVGGQGGFEALALKRSTSPKLVRLALSPGGFSVGKENDETPDPEKKGDKPADDTPLDLTGEATPDPNMQLVAQIKQELSGMGLTLPDTTDGSDMPKFLEHLLVAITAIKGQKQAAAPAATPKPDDPAAAKEAQPQQQMYMSLKQYKDDPAFKALADREAARVKDELAGKIDKLSGLGCPAGIVARMKAYSRGARLSLTAKGVAFDSPVPGQVDLLTEVLSALPERARSWLSQTGAVEAPCPLDRDPNATTPDEDEAMLNRTYPGRKQAIDAKQATPR